MHDMTDHSFARALAVWARNPAGFSWAEVRPEYFPKSLDDAWEWAIQDCRDAGLSGDALDDALDRIATII
jgi:hypothetical protein